MLNHNLIKLIIDEVALLHQKDHKDKIKLVNKEYKDHFTSDEIFEGLRFATKSSFYIRRGDFNFRNLSKIDENKYIYNKIFREVYRGYMIAETDTSCELPKKYYYSSGLNLLYGYK